jgi:hypothetical protein
MSYCQTKGRGHYIRTDYKLFENLSNFESLGTALDNEAAGRST